MDNKKRHNVMLRQTVIDELDRLASEWGVSRSEMIARLVTMHWGDDFPEMASMYAEKLQKGAFMP